MDKLISIVIPVYNVEKYIKECIESVINQTYKNLEIILVNDGSTDLSRTICEEYEKKDNRIKIIDKENGGLADARNKGLEYINGELVTFIDSDDYIKEDMIETLLNNLIKENADVSICGYYLAYNKKNDYKLEENVYIKLNSEKSIDYMNSFKYYDVSAWAKLYKTELFKNIKFPKGKISEDWYIMYKIFDKANSIVYDSSPKYYYRQRNSGISKNSKKVNYDCLIASKECMEFVEKKYPNILESATVKFLVANITTYNAIISNRDYKNDKLQEIVNNIKINRKILKKTKLISNKKKLQFFMITYMSYLYRIIYKTSVKLKEKKYSK